MEQQKDIIVINPSVANHLIQLGYRITKIAKNKYDERRSVFHFEYRMEIEDILSNLKKDS